ncbi:MAG TPA: CRTAC1 family protein [bacterium]|nr:CRTAC1 family protein [bacterium]
MVHTSGYAGNGFCVADFDGDGDVDAAIAGAPGTPFRYFRNDGGMVFTELTASAGLGTSGEVICVRAADIDNDGDQDIFVSHFFQPLKLFINGGNATFTEEAAARGLVTADETFSVTFGDYDRDGWLDMYVGNRYLVGPFTGASPNVLYHNDGNGYFSDVTAQAGCAGIGLTLVTAFFDYNEDNWPDIIEVNDKGSIGAPPNEVWRNNGNGTFTAVGAQINANFGIFGMSVDFLDVFNDGGVDAYFTDLPIDHLFMQWDAAQGQYRDDTYTYGLVGFGIGWASHFLDYDNDGWQDLHVVHQSTPNMLYRNPAMPAAANVSWSDVAPALGLAHAYEQYIAAIADFDDDGRIDLIQRFHEGPPWIAAPDGVAIYQNQTPGGNWIKFRCEGTVSNRDGLGTRIEVFTGSHHQRQWVRSGTGFAASSDARVHFGLGSAATIDMVRLTWPSGQVQYLTGIAANQIVHVKEPQMWLATPLQVGTSSTLEVRIPGDEGLLCLTALSLTEAQVPIPGGPIVPILPDGLTQWSLTVGNPLVPAPIGVLDATGARSVPISVPSSPVFSGLTMYATSLTIDTVNFALFRTSFPKAVTIAIP